MTFQTYYNQHRFRCFVDRNDMYYAQEVKQLFCIDEPIHIRCQVSFAVMKKRALIIGQEFPLKSYGITKRSGRAKVTLNFKTRVCVGSFDHWGKPNTFSCDCLVTETKKRSANAANV